MGKTDKRPNTEKRSYAQLTPDEKDAISHRGNALAALETSCLAFWVSEETQELLCLTRAVGTFSEDRPLGWDPAARRAIAGDGCDSRPKRNVPAPAPPPVKK